MDATITVAIIAATVSVAGWAANYSFSRIADSRRQRIEGLMAHVEKQLSDLYGPLTFLIIEGGASHKDLLSTLGRDQVFQSNAQLSTQERELWLFWVDNDFMPRNEAVQRLLSSNAHLIDGETVPVSYKTFIDHYNSWRVTHLRWKQQGVEYSWHSKIDWPKEFNEDIQSTFTELKQKHAKLVGILAGDSDSASRWLKVPGMLDIAFRSLRWRRSAVPPRSIAEP